MPLLSTHSGITSSITKGLEKKYLFVANPQANPTKKIRITARKIEKGLKSLMISVLKKASKISTMHNPLGDYNNKNIKEIKK